MRRLERRFQLSRRARGDDGKHKLIDDCRIGRRVVLAVNSLSVVQHDGGRFARQRRRKDRRRSGSTTIIVRIQTREECDVGVRQGVDRVRIGGHQWTRDIDVLSPRLVSQPGYSRKTKVSGVIPHKQIEFDSGQLWRLRAKPV